MSIRKILYQSIIWRGLYFISLFFLNICIARHFGAMLSGVMYYVMNIYSLIILFTGLGMESGITYFVARDEIDSAKLFGFSILWSLVAGVLVLLVFVLIPYYEQLIPGKLLLFSAFTFVGGNLLVSFSTAFFYARNNFILPNLVPFIINIILIWMLALDEFEVSSFVTNYNYFYFYFGSIPVLGIVLAATVKIKFLKHQRLKFILLPEIKALLNYCFIAFGSNLIFFLLYRIDYWFVKRYCSADDLGNYIQVSKFGQMFFILPTILASVIFPLTAGGNKRLIIGLITLLSRCLLWLYMMACLFLVLFGNSIFLFVFGESFEKMYQAFLFLIPGILALSLLYTLTAHYAGKNRIEINIKGALLSLAFVVTGDFFFIPLFGINAAALVSSVGYLVYLLFVLRIFVIEYEVPLNSFFIVKAADFKAFYKNFILKNSVANESGYK